MADATLRDTLKIAYNAQSPDLALITISGVNNGGTITRVSDWQLLPDAEFGKYKPIWDPMEPKNRTGGYSVRTKTLIGYDYSTNFIQNDAATYNLFATYGGIEAVLLAKMRRFNRLGTVKQQWLAIFGMMLQQDGESDEKEGKIPFMFTGIPNTQAIVLTSTPAAGKITYPTGAGVTGWVSPSADLTIPAFTGAVGIFVLTDLSL